MKHKQTTAAAQPPGSQGRRHFTLDEARRALVFVRRVVQDIVDRYAEMIKLRDELESLANTTVPEERLIAMNRRNEWLADTLHRLEDELAEVGCQLKDHRIGLIDFPALREGREVLLCWKLGEEMIGHWHEVSEGFGGRKAIGADFAA